MAKKIFSIYSNENYHTDESDHLIIETGNNHLSLVVKSRTENVNALEWFSFTNDEKQYTDLLFKEFVDASAILGNRFASTSLYINNDLQVLVPSAFFQENLVDDYLFAALGQGIGFSTSYDRISADQAPVNVYRYKNDITDYVKERFEITKTMHTYSCWLQNWMILKNMPDVLMNVIFYENSFVAAVFKGGQLQLLRCFSFQAPEDVIYHCLNMQNQLQLSAEVLVIRISGTIDIPSALHTLLQKYFKNVTIETIQLGKINLTGNQHPLHYFTPLFNLAI